MPNSHESQVILSISHHHGRNDRCMDGVDGSCKRKISESDSGGEDERFLKRRLNCDNHGIGCSEDGFAGSRSKEQITRSKFVEVDVSTGSSSISGDIDSEVVQQYEDHPIESANHIAALGDADEDVALSTDGRIESRDDGHDGENTSTISGTVGEGRTVKRVSESQSLERTNTGAYKSMELTQTSKMQWPKWTVSHMLSLSTMDKVMNYYRKLQMANNLTDQDLRCFLNEQLLKERAGLSEKTITNRLRTKPHVSATAGEPDSCSICMVEFKDEDKIASLYYCFHVYHAGCIKEWLMKNNLCPMCRALAIIPEDYPCWNGDVRLHQAFFVHLQYAY